MVQFGKPVFVVQRRANAEETSSLNTYIIDFSAILREMEISKFLSPFAETHEITQGTFEYYLMGSFDHNPTKVVMQGYRVANKERNEARYYDREKMSLVALDVYQSMPEVLPCPIFAGGGWGVKWTHHHNFPSPYLGAENYCMVPQDPPANVIPEYRRQQVSKAA